MVGTTDEPVAGASLEPQALRKEQTFLFEHVCKYFGRRPQPQEIRSMWSGLRPLVRKQGAKSTAALSREHSILVSPSKLVTVIGGKWTTYRRMAEDTVNIAARSVGLPERACTTANLHLHGWMQADVSGTAPSHTEALDLYGCDAASIQHIAEERPEYAQPLHPRLPYIAAEVLWAARHEMARTIEDVLARRTRALFLDARASIEAAPLVANLLANELGKGAAKGEIWIEQQITGFQKLAAGYIYQG